MPLQLTSDQEFFRETTARFLGEHASVEAVRALRQAIAAGDGKPTPALLAELALATNAAGDGAGAKQALEEAAKVVRALADGVSDAAEGAVVRLVR